MVKWKWASKADPQHQKIEVLQAHDGHRVPFDVESGILTPGKLVYTDDVTIAFTDSVGLRWRRTGHQGPVRVVR
jgi:hypothetical protein